MSGQQPGEDLVAGWMTAVGGDQGHCGADGGVVGIAGLVADGQGGQSAAAVVQDRGDH
ncbi:hypothetical protein PV661_09570 [Streptomyces sp. MD20-1-1]|uniref:hypothetical protein n=1 Tax=Streptomyces sp. MD20-1-1 TaxID=3028668 RepID=UPI0029B652BF|nr:hypothetical protein [Streptomyces sp. MD20-1-1]